MVEGADADRELEEILNTEADELLDEMEADESLVDRARIAANASGSLRLEGLVPDEATRKLAALWVLGRATDADLREGERRLLRGESLEELLAQLPRQRL